MTTDIERTQIEAAHASWDAAFNAQDANGPVLQGIFMGTCDELNFYENQLAPNTASLGAILDLLNPPPVAQLPGVTSIPGSGILTCPGG